MFENTLIAKRNIQLPGGSVAAQLNRPVSGSRKGCLAAEAAHV